MSSSSSLVWLSTPSFVCVWLSIVLAHVLLGVFFGADAYLHYYIIAQELQTTIDVLGGQATAFIPWVLGSSVAIVAIHAFQILSLVIRSIKRRELALLTSLDSPRTRSPPCHWLQQVLRWLNIFSVHNTHFDVVFRVTKLVNGGAKFFQVWKLSERVSRIWINRMYALLLTASFLSTPLLSFRFRDRSAFHRIAGLVLDTLFDLIFLTIVPVAIFYPYAQSFGTLYGDFPIEFYYHDTWFIDAIAENQHLFALNWVEFVTKHVTAVSVVTSLQELAGCFVRDHGTRVQPADLSDQSSLSSAGKSMRHATPVHPQVVRVARSKPGSTMFTRLTDLIFLVWGLLVLAIHIHATLVANTSPHPNCYLNLRPWFATSYHCAVLEVNCEVLHHDGDAANISDALMDVNSETLRALIITGCASLELPSRLQAFPQLQMLKIYNSTIVDWPDAAALTETHHPSLKLLYVVKTNFSDPSTLPVGLLSDDFPSALQDIEFCGTNLVSLPMALTRSWKFIQFVVLENSPGITSFPLALVELGVPQLSLCGNGITSISDDVLANQSFWTLSLNGNPLTSLPSSVGRMSDLYRLRLGYSGMASLPWWMRANATSVVAAEDTFEQVVDVKLGGTPFCDRLGGDAVDSSVLEAMTNAYFSVDCGTDMEIHPPILYPLEYEEELRRVRLEWLQQNLERW